MLLVLLSIIEKKKGRKRDAPTSDLASAAWACEVRGPQKYGVVKSGFGFDESMAMQPRFSLPFVVQPRS